MNICYIITRSDWGGAQAHLYDLIQHVHLHTEHDCHLIVGEKGRLAEQVRSLGVPVTILPTITQPMHPWKDIVAVRDIVQVLRKINPDVVHLHSSKAGVVGRIAAHITSIPAVFTAHGWAFTDGVSSLRQMISVPLERWMAHYSEHIICVSEYDRGLALRYRVGNPERLTTIHNGIPDVSDESLVKTHCIDQGDYLSENPLKCIMVARFSTQKDHATLLQASNRMPMRVKPELYFIGQGELVEAVKSLAGELNMQEHVHFLGPRKDVPEHLAQADVFLLTTNYEGFPISVLEAMRAGLPVIASDVGGIKEAVIDEVTGYLVPRGDVKAVKERLEILAKNPALRKQMGEAGRRRFLEFFTGKQMIKKTFAIYQEVLHENL